MSRLLSSSYSSICFIVFCHFIWLLLLLTVVAVVGAKPTPDDSSHKHISSFVNQTRSSQSRTAFDVEQNEESAAKSAQVQQLFGSLLQLPAPLTGNEDAVNKNNIEILDDAPATARNILDDDVVVAVEQHEGSTETPDTWHRVKLNIPVLKSVQDLVNTVGTGKVNDTHVRNNHHRLLGHSGVHHPSPHSNGGNSSSAAIETEEDRETAIDSTGFDVLDTLGTAGSVLWGLLQNVRKLFAASASSASSASSSSGGGNNYE